jgi:hypothetical protein
MKKWGLIFLLVGGVIVGLSLFFNAALFNAAKNPATRTTEESSTAKESSSVTTSAQQPSARQDSPADGSVVLPSGINSNPSSTSPASLADQAGIAAPAAAAPENIPPAIVVENVRRAIRQYGEMFGGNPVGTNPEITAQLNGGNPKQINFIQQDAGMRVNEKGELVDAWDTPLFFHQISGTETEIHSAGPDKIMWTQDDLVTR